MEQSKQFDLKCDFADLGEEVEKVLDAAGSTLGLNDSLAFKIMERLPVKPYLASMDAWIAENSIWKSIAPALSDPPGYWGGGNLEGEVFSSTQRKAKTGDPLEDWTSWEPAQYGPFLEDSGTVAAYFGQLTDNFFGSLQGADWGVEQTCREFGWRLRLCTHCGLPMIANRPAKFVHNTCSVPAGRARRLRWKDKNRDAVNKAEREAYRARK